MKKILLISILFLSFHQINGQTYPAGTVFAWYYDVNPDTLLNYTVAPYTHEVYPLNLFEDVSNDLELIAHGAVSSGGSAAYVSITSNNPNVYIRQGRLDSVFVPATSNWYVTSVAHPLLYGEEIDEGGATWENSTLYLTDHSGSGGGNKNVNDWIGGEKYIGLKYQNASSVAYAWIRVECTTKDSCFIKEFSASPPLVGVAERNHSNAIIFPNPVTETFYFKNLDVSGFDISKLDITDLYGKKVKFSSDLKDKDLKIELDPGVSEGCYVVQYTSNQNSFSRKLVKINK
ncbi:MAG: Secretion system C-terminal sorting domain [Bacteroidetes bacterium]|jgi:hypothetical protein|nr:Secretion system C-terminal sorting domain [Bacteroidota bacterium]